MEVMHTSNYDFFKRTTNRDLKYQHIKSLVFELEANKEAFKSSPVVINPDGYLIDGQHRVEASKIAGLPVYYIVDENAKTLDEVLTQIRKRNVGQKPWDIYDYVKFYSETNEEYAFLNKLYLKYMKNFSLSIIIAAVECKESRTRKKSKAYIAKSGKLTIVNKEKLAQFIDVFNNDLEDMNCPLRHKKTMCTRCYFNALYKLYYDKQPRINYDVFIRKVSEYSHCLRKAQTEIEAMECIGDICNKRTFQN